MIVFNTKSQINNYLKEKTSHQKTIGFVPTMGALHQGHISLINKAKKECDIVVASIFVNPTQFNDLNDLEKYPRNLENDCKLLETAGCHCVFAPDLTEMYSQQELELKKQKVEDKSWKGNKKVEFGVLESVMEGAHRPGHFNGVTQVVSKLFRIIEPNKAYFGLKDYQQLAIIKSMTKQLEMPIQIIGCPIVRENNGLAMSSRNENLNIEDQKIATLLSKILIDIKNMSSTNTIAELKAYANTQITNIAPSIQLEYFEISDPDTLEPYKETNNANNAIACIAAKIKEVRLIDNIMLD